MPGVDKWKTVPPKVRDEGYVPVCLCGVGRKKRRTYIHILIAECFIGPKPFAKACVRHLDGNPRNNAVDNIAWGTYAENEEDKRRHGTYDLRRSNVKLTPAKKEKIKEMAAAGYTHTAIARKVKVSRPTVSRFLNGKTWK